MIIQEANLSQGFFISLSTILVVELVIFVIGIIITRWWAIKEGWNDTYNPSIRLNLFWLACNLVFFIILIQVIYGLFIAILISYLINIIIGGLITAKLYEKKFKESLIFVLFIVLILFIIWFIVFLITTIIIAVILIGLQIN